MFEYNHFLRTAPHLSPAFPAAFHLLSKPQLLCVILQTSVSLESRFVSFCLLPLQLNAAAAQNPVALSRRMDLCGAQGGMGSDVSLTILEESVTCTLKAPLSCYSM